MRISIIAVSGLILSANIYFLLTGTLLPLWFAITEIILFLVLSLLLLRIQARLLGVVMAFTAIYLFIRLFI
ncbi:hypothetical protein [Alkalicoccus urumqiensis]|uniref:Uncharacterized protein n=1 Tax=Alkalicoccus urumqiensis TaxID=1548213 RepID=A0A2P6MG97_ALKUR|nr:hypothetical protein [Alkalicoccus urumqiensis]PRO65291.1 hypothetical protein C6I21_10855 [Alkalicoccus urumqiensis]